MKDFAFIKSILGFYHNQIDLAKVIEKLDAVVDDLKFVEHVNDVKVRKAG